MGQECTRCLKITLSCRRDGSCLLADTTAACTLAGEFGGVVDSDRGSDTTSSMLGTSPCDSCTASIGVGTSIRPGLLLCRAAAAARQLTPTGLLCWQRRAQGRAKTSFLIRSEQKILLRLISASWALGRRLS